MYKILFYPFIFTGQCIIRLFLNIKLIAITVTHLYCHFRVFLFLWYFFWCVYSTFINKNFSAFTKSQAPTHPDMLPSRTFSCLNTFNMPLFLQQTLFLKKKKKLFPAMRLFQKLPVILEPKLSNKQLWDHKWKPFDDGASGFMEYTGLLL